ncbi:MAG: glutamate 5-kinase [bacterium]|nr:glutamate 5-kinase [bacterium]
MRSVIENAKNVAVKVGSSVLTNLDGKINHDVLSNIVSQVNWLIEGGRKVTIVSSGARSAGFGRVGRWADKADMKFKQALCSVGQVELMKEYEANFAAFGRNVGQLLLTHEDFDDRLRYLNIRNTLLTLIEGGIVPIINENDTVSTDEIKIGDNDYLSALVAIAWGADLLVILTNIDGVHKADPTTNRQAELLQRIENIDDFVTPGKGRKSVWGTGGIATKVDAARKVAMMNIPTLILNGTRKDVIIKAALGKDARGTLILPSGKGFQSRKRWLAVGKRVKGKLVVDEGAEAALRRGGKSLLSVGVKKVEGRFKPGDLVSIVSMNQGLIGKGLVEYNSEELQKIAGAKVGDIERILGQKTSDEVIHRDNMVILG